MYLELERHYDLGMDALVSVCSKTIRIAKKKSGLIPLRSAREASDQRKVRKSSLKTSFQTMGYIIGVI